MLQIHSEHAIGFLKGRFQSLKNLQLDIRNKKTHKISCYLVGACVGIHAFAMDCEAEEKSESSDDSGDVAAVCSSGRAVGLYAAKAHCEGLKQKLFDAKMKKAWPRHAECILSH